MKVKVQVTTYEEIEVNYPVYKAHGHACYKITEQDTVEVRNEKSERGIKIGKLCYTDLVLANGNDITEQEFNTAFLDALEFLAQRSPLATIS